MQKYYSHSKFLNHQNLINLNIDDRLFEIKFKKKKKKIIKLYSTLWHSFGRTTFRMAITLLNNIHFSIM
jgi:hypothetical protein